MRLKGQGYFVREFEPYHSEKNNKVYFSCEIQSLDKTSNMRLNLEKPLVQELKDSHYPKVEFVIEQQIINSKNGTFVVNNLIDIKKL